MPITQHMEGINNLTQDKTNKQDAEGGGPPRPLPPIRLHRRMIELGLKKDKIFSGESPIGGPHEWELA